MTNVTVSSSLGPNLPQLLLGLPALVSKSHYEIEIVGIVRATALQSDPSELNECQVCVSASSLLAPQSKVPIIHIKHPQPLSRIRSASLADIDGTHGASDHAFPPCHAVQEGIMLGVMCTNSPEIYDCIAWSIHQLVQHEAFTRSVLGPPIGNLRSPPSPVRGATSDHSLSLENIIRELDSHRWWWSALALSWIAFTECTFNTTELLSALVAEGAYRSSVESTAVFNMHLSTLHDTELKSLLYQALIISEAGEIMLSREEARATLMRLIADVGGLDDGAIHEMIAYTCLRCIECYQPTSVLRPWTIKESYADPQPSTSRLLLYATSFWHVHFRLAEDCSHRLSALLQRIIRSALTLDQENCQTDRIDAVQIINVGMWICAFYGFSLLAQTYLEMGAEIDPFSWPHTNPLHVAASRSSLSVLEVVLASHPSLDTVNQEGMTPLHIAAFYGNVEAAKMLLDAGSDANAVCPKSRETALHIAVRSGHGTVVALLLDQGADIDAKNRAFETAMSIALQHKMHAIAQTLEQCGAARSNPLPMGTSAADVIYDLQALSLAELDTSSPQDASSYDLQQSAEVHINISYHQ